MEKEILKDAGNNTFYTIELCPEGWLHARWIGKITDKKVQEGGKLAILFTKNTGCQYLINDNLELVGSWLSAIDWIEQELTPNLIEAGNKYIAHILSPDFITKFSAVELNERLKKDHFKLFTSLEEAETWIKSKIE
jgi:hypothetical protein